MTSSWLPLCPWAPVPLLPTTSSCILGGISLPGPPCHKLSVGLQRPSLGSEPLPLHLPRGLAPVTYPLGTSMSFPLVPRWPVGLNLAHRYRCVLFVLHNVLRILKMRKKCINVCACAHMYISIHVHTCECIYTYTPCFSGFREKNP